MEKGMVKVYCGDGKGKSAIALGRALLDASEGKEIFIIQFLKGKSAGTLEYLDRLEPEIKVFRFEKEACNFENLDEQEQREEKANILNGINFARKVLSIGECDVLVLDEVLGLIDLGIITLEDVLKLIEIKDEEIELILTGRNMPDGLAEHVDYIAGVETIKNILESY